MKTYIAWIFKLSQTQCKVSPKQTKNGLEKNYNSEYREQENNLEFFVKAIYDDYPISFEFCGGEEFCPLSRFFEFLETNTYYYSKDKDSDGLPTSQFRNLC